LDRNPRTGLHGRGHRAGIAVRRQHQHWQARPALRQFAQQRQAIAEVTQRQRIDHQQIHCVRVLLQQRQQLGFFGVAGTDLDAAVLPQHHFHTQPQDRMRIQQRQPARPIGEQGRKRR